MTDLSNFKFVGKDLIIEKGNTYLAKPLILPKNFNLVISLGAKLIFSEESYIEIDGGNIQALGSSTDNIYFKPVDKIKNWKGILVKNSKKISF